MEGYALLRNFSSNLALFTNDGLLYQPVLGMAVCSSITLDAIIDEESVEPWDASLSAPVFPSFGDKSLFAVPWWIRMRDVNKYSFVFSHCA